MIDFIVPSIGRNTITRSLNSLISQTNPDWNCYVGFDGMKESDVDKNLLLEDNRIHYLFLGEKLGTSSFHGNAGKVRNKIIASIENPSEWIGFLDDDDSLSHYYIEILKNELNKEDYDCFVFRMNHNGNIIPPFEMQNLVQNHVGISFCVKTKFIKDTGIKFENNNAEDFMFLSEIFNHKGRIKLLPYVGYFVGV